MIQYPDAQQVTCLFQAPGDFPILLAVGHVTGGVVV
jgi:hypothetical protein